MFGQVDYDDPIFAPDVVSVRSGSLSDRINTFPAESEDVDGEISGRPHSITGVTGGALELQYDNNTAMFERVELGAHPGDIIFDGLLRPVEPADVDVIRGRAGLDLIHGNEGDDDLDGGDHEDEIYGGGGDDMIHGSFGVDILHGDGGNDTIYGGLESGLVGDFIWGGPGDDDLFGESGLDEIRGQLGDDLIVGGIGGETVLNGGPGPPVM